MVYTSSETALKPLKAVKDKREGAANNMCANNMPQQLLQDAILGLNSNE